MKQVGISLAAALAAGVPSALAANIVATGNTVRLRNYFVAAAARFLDTHRQIQMHRTHALVKERNRLKALLCLVRARQKMVGIRRQSVAQNMAQLDIRHIHAHLALAA